MATYEKELKSIKTNVTDMNIILTVKNVIIQMKFLITIIKTS